MENWSPKVGVEQMFKEIIAEVFLNLRKTITTDPRISRNPKHRNMRKATPKHIIINLLKDNDKILKAAQNTYAQRNKDDSQFLIRNYAMWRTVEEHLENTERKTTINENFIASKKKSVKKPRKT